MPINSQINTLTTEYLTPHNDGHTLLCSSYNSKVDNLLRMGKEHCPLLSIVWINMPDIEGSTPRNDGHALLCSSYKFRMKLVELHQRLWLSQNDYAGRILKFLRALYISYLRIITEAHSIPDPGEPRLFAKGIRY